MFQGLSRVSDGLIVAELDLNLCRQVKDKWGFRVCYQLQLHVIMDYSLIGVIIRVNTS